MECLTFQAPTAELSSSEGVLKNSSPSAMCPMDHVVHVTS